MIFAPEEKKKKRWLLIPVISLLALAVVFAGLSAAGVFRLRTREARAVRLRCAASQNVKPFGSDILYYDGMTLFCLSAEGAEKWSYSVGGGADFNCDGGCVAVWMENQLYIIDRSGRATYNDHLKGTVQFAKSGSRYVAAVIGDGFSPTVTVKDLSGITVDEESNAYTDQAVLDMGFFGDGEYLYVSTIETYGTVMENKLYTIRVGQMNTGEMGLGEQLTAGVAYAGGKMYVVGTKDVRVCDYRCTVDSSATRLIYGWQMADWRDGGSGAEILFAPTRQLTAAEGITELRLLRGSNDRRIALPTGCVSVMLYGGQIYAFSQDALYRIGYRDTHFTPVGMSLPGRITACRGVTSGGVALVCCGEDMYAVTLP